MNNPSRISSHIDALKAMRENKAQLKKELKASKANIFKGTPLEGPAATALKWVDSWQKHPDTYLFARIPYDIIIK